MAARAASTAPRSSAGPSGTTRTDWTSQTEKRAGPRLCPLSSDMTKPKLLFVGDSPTCPTGFARVSDNLLKRLADRWDITVLGINFFGDPYDRDRHPYPIYPAASQGEIWGIGRFEGIAKHVKPDVALVLNDVWIVAHFAELRRDFPLACYTPVDAQNIHPSGAKALNKLGLSIFYTDFGLEEARLAGFKGRSAV